MIYRIASALLLVLLGQTAAAQNEEIVAELSQNRVSITASFDGSEILLFGAVKRETGIQKDKPLQVIITVSGPLQPVMVRRKSRRAGIWINTDALEIDEAPSFYAVSTTGPLDQILSQTEDLRHRISLDRAIRSVGAPAGIEDMNAFTEALIRIRKKNGLYNEQIDGTLLIDQTLFRTEVALPANLVEGNYTARIFLTRDRKVVNSYTTTLYVNKVGLERWIYVLAHDQPLLYGLLSLALAMFAGWGASTAFRYIRS
ncbi:TIGR02186 family protein [Brevirhabdus sp.]|uniref:TIGR02186 family protein n=1 Tax=Brevirhabdus sp. TaxID=2004514 RepID=UPI004057E0B5